VTRVDADIDALKEFHAALVRFRHAQQDLADRAGEQMEATRASLAEKASRWRAILARRQAELEDCRRRAAAGQASQAPPAEPDQAGAADDQMDCSSCARAVAEATQRLEQICRWQQRVDEEAAAFGGIAGGFRNLLETDLPRTEAHLVAVIGRLEAARDVKPSGA
jgi:hypothetical protein